MNTQTPNSTKLYEMAKSLIGYNLCTNAQLGCAETVNEIARRAWGKPIGGGASTENLATFLADPTQFDLVTVPLPGDIVISPTGSPGAILDHGHVGIVAIYGILSNSSSDGRLHENYDIETWTNYFGTYGKFPVLFYRKK